MLTCTSTTRLNSSKWFPWRSTEEWFKCNKFSLLIQTSSLRLPLIATLHPLLQARLLMSNEQKWLSKMANHKVNSSSKTLRKSSWLKTQIVQVTRQSKWLNIIQRTTAGQFMKVAYMMLQSMQKFIQEARRYSWEQEKIAQISSCSTTHG